MTDIGSGEIRNGEMRDRLGNIDQIRELLFGHQSRDFEQRFDQITQRVDQLEASLSKFQVEVRDELKQLQGSLSTEIRVALDSLDKKLQYLRLTHSESVEKLQHDLQSIEQKSSHGLLSLHENTTNQLKLIQTEASHIKAQLEADIQGLRHQVYEEMEKELSQLKDHKLSRSMLADVLFDLCLKVKGNELSSASDVEASSIKAELLLPEQR
jgi:hypothetical protein